MRYLTFSADYMEPSLRDDDSDKPRPWDMLAPQLKAEIVRWNDDYRPIVSMDLAQRKAMAELIDDLDARGLNLASRIAEKLGQAKVRYYSEGLLSYRS